MEFNPPAEAPLTVTLAPNVGNWTGVTVGDYLLRIKPDLFGDPGQESVLFSMEISRQTGDAAFVLIATPRGATKFSREAVVRIGNEVVGQTGEQDGVLSLTLVPRLIM